MTESYAKDIPPKVGYFPNTFPRDPVEINNFHEHVIIGQIIEPLVESAPTGEVIPSIAASWEISADSKSITFHIRPNLKFSNGQSVTASDVKYSIERQKNSPISQSRSYLTIITSIDVLDEMRLRVTLARPYIAFFKSLSRDHLGILPAGWKFEAKSNEPIIGTGPYRIVKKAEKWWLVENTNYRKREDVAIKEWEVVLFDPKNPNYAGLPVPDLIPSIQPELKAIVETEAPKVNKLFLQSEINHFVQMSGWWYPHGRSYNNVVLQERTMRALTHLLRLRGKKLGYRLATGVIPEGIAGYINEATSGQSNEIVSDKTKLSVRIAVVEKDLKTIAAPEDVSETESLFNVKLAFEPVAITNFASLKDSKPDAVILAHAGGFQDPEGFLVVVSSVLNTDLKTLFGDIYDSYLACSSESNWTKRADMYKTFNRQLVSKYIISPGWKPPLYQMRSPQIEALDQGVGYTTKLINFRFKDRKEGKNGTKY
jgi:hypothetical protein